MSGFCAVITCRRKSGHQFPKDKKQRAKWIAAVNVNRKNWRPSASSFICYDHFKKDDYKEETGHQTAVKRLKKGVVPSICMQHKHKEAKEDYTPAKQLPRSHYCCICKRKNSSHRHLTFHSFPTQGKTFISVKDEMTGDIVKKDRFTLWAEFANLPEAKAKSRDICSLHFKPDDYIYPGYDTIRRSLKIIAVPSIYDVDDIESPADEVLSALQLPTQDQVVDEEMQIETVDDVIRPPDMLCAIYSLPDSIPAELDVQDFVTSSQSCTINTQVLDSTEVLDDFYSRCLLCTCRPDATPHIEIFSEASNQLDLAVKIEKHLNLQIEPGLPQRVCHGCWEKLEATHELVTVSHQARILLLQIKQQSRNLDTEVTFLDQENLDNSFTEETFEHVDIQQTSDIQIKVEQDSMDSIYSENDSELDPLEPSTDFAAIEENSISIKTEISIDDSQSDSNSSAANGDQSSNHPVVHSSEEPIVCESINKPATESEKPRVSRCMKKKKTDAVKEADFVKCSQCSSVIYKGYMAFHVKTHHEQMTPVPAATVLDEETMRQKEVSSPSQKKID